MKRKIILFIFLSLLFLILVGCRTPKNGQWIEEEIVVSDTLYFREIHEHFYDYKGNSDCIYIEPWSSPYVDTLRIQYHKPKN